MLVRTPPDSEYYLMVRSLRFDKKIERLVRDEIFSVAESALVYALIGTQAIAIRIQCRRKFRAKTQKLFLPYSMRSRCFFALELDENHVQRFIANVLCGVRQRLAKQNFARL